MIQFSFSDVVEPLLIGGGTVGGGGGGGSGASARGGATDVEGWAIAALLPVM